MNHYITEHWHRRDTRRMLNVFQGMWVSQPTEMSYAYWPSFIVKGIRADDGSYLTSRRVIGAFPQEHI